MSTTYTPYDRISIPQDVPELGVASGDAGLVEDLTLGHETVTASVRVEYSTGRPRGWIRMTVKPEERVVSFLPV